MGSHRLGARCRLFVNLSDRLDDAAGGDGGPAARGLPDDRTAPDPGPDGPLRWGHCSAGSWSSSGDATLDAVRGPRRSTRQQVAELMPGGVSCSLPGRLARPRPGGGPPAHRLLPARLGEHDPAGPLPPMATELGSGRRARGLIRGLVGPGRRARGAGAGGALDGALARLRPAPRGRRRDISRSSCSPWPALALRAPVGRRSTWSSSRSRPRLGSCWRRIATRITRRFPSASGPWPPWSSWASARSPRPSLADPAPPTGRPIPGADPRSNHPQTARVFSLRPVFGGAGAPSVEPAR